MSDYQYYLYSSFLVARVGKGTTERLMPDAIGSTIHTVGKFSRKVENLRMRKKLSKQQKNSFEQEKQWGAEEKAEAKHEVKVAGQQNDQNNSHPDQINRNVML